MIHAYDKCYLPAARTALGRALDYAVYDAGMALPLFWEAFLASPYSRQFEQGNPKVVAGMSGVEIACAVLHEAGMQELPPARYTVERSAEFWAGWALARYQWTTALPFSEITRAVPIERVVEFYHPYHEMDVSQFVAKMNELYRCAFPDSRLKRRRVNVGLSQRELAELSGVPLRTLQQYEQRQKNLGRAGAETVIKLAQVLSCDPIDLLDLVPATDEQADEAA